MQDYTIITLKNLATILELNRKSIETAEIEERLLALERRGKVE